MRPHCACLLVPFTVLVNAPLIDAVVPDSGRPGTSVTAQIQGSWLDDVTDLLAGQIARSFQSGKC